MMQIQSHPGIGVNRNQNCMYNFDQEYSRNESKKKTGIILMDDSRLI